MLGAGLVLVLSNEAKEHMEKKIPKYMAVVEWAKEQIHNDKIAYGAKFHSENELSKRFDVSRQTIRQAMGILEQENILQRRQGSGTFVVYRPESRTLKTMNIGLISTYLDQYIFPSIISGIESVLTSHGYSMQMTLTHNRVESEKQAIDLLREKGVDGIIAEPTKSALPSPNIDMYHQLYDQHMPLVFFNAYYPGTSFPHVCMDDQMAGKMAADYLISQGHRNILGLFQLDDLQGHLRYAGYMQALNQAGILIRPDRVTWFASEEREEFVQDDNRFLNRLKDCTAVLCYNDEIAFNVVRKVQEYGLDVPKDISVIGIDDSNMSLLSAVPLTSIAHPGRLLGEAAARNVLRLIDDPTFDANVDFKPSLVIRESVRRM